VRHRHRRAHRLEDAIDVIETEDHASFPDLELERAGNVRLERADVHRGANEQPPRQRSAASQHRRA
jgi:hypothetical protein